LLAGKCFDGATSLADIHDSVQAEAGNATWCNEFLPIVKSCERKVAEVLLRLFHKLGLCCGIVGDFAMYIAGKTPTHSGCITIYTGYHPAKLTTDIGILFQITPTAAFTLHSLDFLFIPQYSIPGKIIHYIAKQGNTTIPEKIVCVYCAVTC
jgi:hypothetical protein